MQNERASERQMENVREVKPQERRTRQVRPGPAVPGHRIQYDEEHHIWLIDQVLISCSVSEYQCLKLLLEGVNRCVPFAHLLVSLQETPCASSADSKQERMRIAHLMSTLRPKIWALGLDIVSVVNVGYLLLSGAQESSVSSQESLSPDA